MPYIYRKLALFRATSYTRLRARDVTPQALSLVEKAKPVQVRFTLHLRDQRSMWMQDGCKVYMDSYMTSGSYFMVIWTIFGNHLLEVGLTPILGDHGTPNAHNHWFTLFCHVWGSAWIEIPWNNILVEALVTYDFTRHLRVRDHSTWFRRVSCNGLWTLSFGLSHFHGHGSLLMCEVGHR